jgi:TRAP-type C4-dicarboxylate transport system permease small subunit
MSTRVRHFARHYAEMVAAMFLGMVVLGIPAEGALRVMGSSSSAVQADAPALMLLWMAVTMTVPMVGWMAYRGHGRRANAEMAASMLLPAFGVIGLLAAGVMTDFAGLMGLEHAVMLPSMLVAMLLRADEYAGHVTGAEPAVAS